MGNSDFPTDLGPLTAYVWTVQLGSRTVGGRENTWREPADSTQKERWN